MRTALRKMGNSTGMIIPKAILSELDTQVGTKFDIEIKDKTIVATPVASDPRAVWAAELKALADAGELEELTEDERAWMSFGNEFDAEWEW